MWYKEISFSDIEGVRVGNAQDDKAKTGCTVLVFPQTALVGSEISGGGPASRETPLTHPERSDTPVNAIVLSGGSAYGLAAGDGVMKCLEENGMGYRTPGALVPIVLQSDIYDLTYGSSTVRPDAEMGYEACRKALEKSEVISGNAGAGTGATVGKVCGMARAQKCGIGYAAVEAQGVKVGAVVVVNALGDIFQDVKKVAGLTTEDRKEFADWNEEFFKSVRPEYNFYRENTNTTIGAIITNGEFSKAQLTKLASMTRSAYSKCIIPCGTMADGDTIYAASAGEKRMKFDINATGILAIKAMELAIQNAVESSKISDEEYLSNINVIK